MKKLNYIFIIILIIAGNSLTFTSLEDSFQDTTFEWIDSGADKKDYPVGRAYHEMVYDSKSDVMIMVHGQFSFPDNLPQETWAYSVNANQWANMQPEEQPGKRTGFGFAYDSKNGVSILFGGGENNTQPYRDTWAYNYIANTWTNMKPDISPPARVGHEMVFDSQSGKIILVGGRSNVLQDGDFYNDVWTYDYETNMWQNVTPSINPPKRWFFSMVYNSINDKTILFGGYSRIETNPVITRHDFKNDTWAFDLETLTWTELHPIIAPDSRGYSSGAYHEQLNEFILYGGWNQDKEKYFDDTWAFDYINNTWTQLEINSPDMRTHCSMAYDIESNVLVIYGGYKFPYQSFGKPTTWILEPNSRVSNNSNSLPFSDFLMIISVLFLLVIKKRRSRIKS